MRTVAWVAGGAAFFGVDAFLGGQIRHRLSFEHSVMAGAGTAIVFAVWVGITLRMKRRRGEL